MQKAYSTRYKSYQASKGHRFFGNVFINRIDDARSVTESFTAEALRRRGEIYDVYLVKKCNAIQ